MQWTYQREKENGITFLACKSHFCFCEMPLTEANGFSSSFLMRKQALIPISVLATSLPRHMINTLLRSCHVYQLLLLPAPSVHINVSLFSCSAFSHWLHSGLWLSTGTNICQKRRTPPKKMVMLPLFFPLFFLYPYKQGQKVSWFSFSAWISKNGSTTMGRLDKEERFAFSFHWWVTGEFWIFLLLVIFQQSSHGHQGANAARLYSAVRVNFIPIPISV